MTGNASRLYLFVLIDEGRQSSSLSNSSFARPEHRTQGCHSITFLEYTGALQVRPLHVGCKVMAGHSLMLQQADAAT